MKGDALSLFKWMYQNHQLFDWNSFTKALELRFGPSTYANHQAELFKLRQTGSVSEYQAQFKKLGNRVIGLPAEALLNCFIFGLNTEIRNEMAIQRPTSITQAIGLAKLIEAKCKDTRPRIIKPFSHNFSNTFSRPPSSTTQIALTLPTTASSHTTVPPKPHQPSTTKFPIKKLNQTQVQERRALGLCYNCDEKVTPGHKCSIGRFLLLLVEDENEEVKLDCDQIPVEEPEPLDQPDTYFQLSPQAVTGQFSPQTLKFQGWICGKPVIVLVYTGSTHNILQPRIASHLNLSTEPIPHFSVMVGNGSHIEYQGTCQAVPITLQQARFNLPFYLFPIEGADVVLGMAWLHTLGHLQADFSIRSITFQHNNEYITLRGDPNPHPTQSTFHQICHLIDTDSIASFHLLSFEPINNLPTPKDSSQNHTPTTTQSQPEVHNLLTHYPTVFQPPHSLPLSRPHDHRIPLLPNRPPVNVKQYRYPHSQNDTMTTLIHEMLRDGTIIPSTSPFTSPVLLVRKKDGSWQFCVDYRGLNAVTIKYRFPIPTIDELLDELGNATIFSKIDLHSGYLQIRVASEDTYKTTFRTFDGHYEFLVMPFGLSNAPYTFQSVRNDLLRPYLRRFVLVFFDDILIYSTNRSDHLLHLRLILDLLAANHFVAKLSKCVFVMDTVDYLGHVISATELRPIQTR